ncbi:MAG TPA: glycosyltransferase family 39 protein [Polyangiaceae bacterium]|jgi:4-amino-4-deoxy-L-arabinose transferase-like glycosyltransferase
MTTPAAETPKEPVEAPEPAASPKRGATDDEERSLPRGNLPQWKRGGVTAFAGGFAAFLLMAHNGQLRLGVPLGFLCMLVATWGVLDLAGTFDDDVKPAGIIDRRELVRSIAALVGAGLVFCATVMGGQSGTLKQWIWGLLVTLAFELVVYTVFNLGVKLGPWAKDEGGVARPIWKRHGFWLITIAACLYLPCLGSYSLWDPWETHYGEVSREILARDDWISLWWAQDGWFWSKPILNFWIQAIAMATLGTHYQPDKMLIGDGHAPILHPEWVVRTPNFLLTVVGLYLLYKGVAKVFGRRAGLLGGLVLATMPDWYFLAHQTMTDMPFVAPMCGAMGLLLLGLATEENKRARVWELDAFKHKWRLSAWHLVFGVIILCTLPQILYLLSRNIELVVHGDGPKGFRFHWDEFKSGSGMGNCGLPGNEACNLTHPASIPRAAGIHPDTFGGSMLRFFGGFEPALQAIVWSAGLGALMYLNWGERRVRRLYYIAAWFFAAVATMGKGPAGFGLPGLVGLAYVASTKRWSELTRFEGVSGLLVILIVAIPWYVAMYVRHGSPFTDRLIFHDMFNRAFHHVHDTNEGDDTSFRFYIWQLGYALYPWIALAPLGLLWWIRKPDTQPGNTTLAKNDLSIMLAMWFVFAFALFSFMGTKFHHYIFPAVPPIAMLIGIVLDDMLGRTDTSSPRLAATGVAIGAGLAIGVVLLTYALGGSIWGEKGVIFGGADKIALALACVAVPIALVIASRWRSAAMVDLPEDEPVGAVPAPDSVVPYRGGGKVDPAEALAAEREAVQLHERRMWGAAVVGGALVLLLVGRDLASKGGESPDQDGAIRLLHLFTYNYRRPWPDTLNFDAVIGAFTAIAAVIVVALAVTKIRRWAVIALCSLSVVWALWGLDVYMVRTAPHWGQHEITQAYYEARSGPEEPLVAYQMNWKGENFYTGNHIPAFVSSGPTFTQWIRQQKEKGVKVMFFVTEHTRTSGLRSEVQAKHYTEITDKALCNKFVLVRAEL